MAPRRDIGALFALALALAPVLVAISPAVARPAGTLDALAAELDRRLGRAVEGEQLGQIDLAFALRRGPGVGSGLLRAVRELMLGRLTARPFRRVEQAPPRASAARRRGAARAAGFERLLDLELTIVGGHLHLQGALVATDRLLWRDMLRPERGIQSHLHARVRVDAEVRAYQGRSAGKGVRFAPRSHALGQRTVLDLAVGDLDADGRNEVVVLHPRRLALLRHGGRGSFKQLHELTLVPPRARLRPRRPLGSVVIVDLDGDGRRDVVARTSAMARAVVLSLGPGGLARAGAGAAAGESAAGAGAGYSGYPLMVRRDGGELRDLRCTTVQGRDIYDASSLAGSAASTLPPGLATVLLPGFYDLKQVAIASKGGGRVSFLGVVDSTGQLLVFEHGRPRPLLTVARTGIAFDLVDLDDDGALEVVTTSASLPGAKDRITVMRHGSTGRLLWRSQRIAGEVTTVGHGDIDGDGKLELLAAVRGHRGRRVRLMVLNP